MPILEVEHISKSFGKTEVLKDISFSLEKGQVVSIIGSSGSGKTTLLRCLNFLERPNTGIIRVNDDILFDGREFYVFPAQRISTKNTHGTGCTLSSAITAFLAQGFSIPDACKYAKQYVFSAIQSAFPIGNGHGPLNHFYEFYQLKGKQL